METRRYRRLVGRWSLTALLGAAACVVGCSRQTREAPEQRTENVRPERLPLAPEVAPPIEAQDAERAQEHAQNEARGAEPAPATERSDVERVGGTVGAESGKMQPCEEGKRETASTAGTGRSAIPSDASAKEKGRQLARRMEASGQKASPGLGEGSASSVVPLVPTGVGAERGQADTANQSRANMPANQSSSLAVKSPTTLRGQVLYGGPKLPETAQLHVALIGTESGTMMTQQTMSAAGEPPYAFSLQLPGAVSDLSNYSVRVTIEDKGQVLYSTLTPYQENMAEGSVLPVQIGARAR